MSEGWSQRLKRQDRFLKTGQGHFLIIAGFSEGLPENKDDYQIEGQPSIMSEEFLRRHAYELGIKAAKYGAYSLSTLKGLNDDAIPCLGIDWGVGVTAALFTGGKVIFQQDTAYSVDSVIKTWDDIDRLKFNPDNRWVKYDLEFWRGVASAYVPGLALTPHLFRSPLDLANDLRGNRIFEDMYDEPEQVDRLVTVCTDMIIEAVKFFWQSSPILRESPSGVWGMATSAPDMIFVNGDPVDLVSPEMGERFNHPHIERLARETGPVFFHHHTLGVSRVSSVSKIRGMIIQNFIYDTKCPKILEILDDEWIEASRRVPIEVCQDLTEASDIDAVLEKMSRGRFIVHAFAKTRDECNDLIDRVRRYES